MRKTVDSENANTDYMLQEAYKKSVVTESRIRYVENSLRTLTDRVNDGTTESLINSIDQLNRKTNEINNTLKTKADINHTHNNYATKTELTRYATTQQLNRTEQELQRDMDTKISNAKDELNKTIDSTKEELTEAIDDNVKIINESITSLEQDIGNKAESSHTHTTADITDLNMSVYAPAQHTHTLSNITDLDISNYATIEQLNNKADINHAHTIDNISDLQTSLNNKANTVHTHTISDVADLQTSLDGKANTSHTHAIQDITGFDGSNYVTTEQLDTTKQELIQSINTKANASHTHVMADITDYEAPDIDISNLATKEELNDKANTVHTHNINDVTNLQSSLDNKANASHTHDEYITKSQMLELLYPIGSLYVSMNNTNPNTVLGIGTWTQITDKFLYCANSSGTNGGNSTITLTVDNLPSHNHTFTGVEMTGEFRTNNNTAPFQGGNENWASAQGVFKRGESIFSYGTNSYGSSTMLPALLFEATPEGTISNTGSGQAFSIMPPYMTVYAWCRTA